MDKISIVTVLKNRYEYLEKSFGFLNTIDHLDCVEHVVVDFDSDDGDVAGLLSSGKVKYNHVLTYRKFAINVGRNIGINEASNELVFISDSDIIVDRNLVKIINRYVNNNVAYFPTVRDLPPDADIYDIKESDLGRWRSAGYGMCGITKSMANSIGYDENYNKWGGDDWDFYRRLRKKHKIIRNGEHGFYHIHHPRGKGFLNKYYK